MHFIIATDLRINAGIASQQKSSAIRVAAWPSLLLGDLYLTHTNFTRRAIQCWHTELTVTYGSVRRMCIIESLKKKIQNWCLAVFSLFFHSILSKNFNKMQQLKAWIKMYSITNQDEVFLIAKTRNGIRVAWWLIGWQVHLIPLKNRVCVQLNVYVEF